MKRFLFILACALILGAASITFASDTSQVLVAEGRVLLFNHADPTYSKILSAKDKFSAAIAVDAEDEEAHLFYSASLIASFCLEEGNGAEARTLRDMLTAFGVPFDETIDSPAQGMPYGDPPDIYGQSYLPDSTPDGEAVETFLSGPFLDLIDDMLGHLNLIIGETFNTIITSDESGADAVEIDYSDILAARSILYSLKFYLNLITAYDLHVSIRDMVFIGYHEDMLTLQGIMADYPNLLHLTGVNGEDGKASLAAARTALLNAFDAYRDGLASIKAETDNPADDLIFFESQEDIDAAELILPVLTEIKSSLNENRAAAFTFTEEQWHLSDTVTGDEFDLFLEFDMNGNFSDGDIEADCDDFPFCNGWIEKYSVSGTNLAIQLQTYDWHCGVIEFNMTGTLADDQITNGHYAFTDCDNENFSGDFTGTRTNTETTVVTFDLNALFGNATAPVKSPLDIRSVLPDFDRFSQIIPGTFPEAPILNGMFPDMVTNDDLTKTLELQPGGFFNIPTIGNGAISVDGNDTDWPANALAFTDIQNDEDADADFSGGDIKNLFLAKDATWLYIGLHLYDGDPNATDKMAYFVDINSDWDWAGYTQDDRLAVVSYDGTAWISSVKKCAWHNHKDLLNHSPQVINEYSESYAAAGTKFIEWKVLLADMGDMTDKYIRVASHLANGQPVSDYNTTRIALYTASATGTVTFTQTPYTGGNIYIGAFSGPSTEYDAYGGTWLSQPGNFEISGLSIDQTVYFFALLDQDDNGVKSIGDYAGFASGTVSQDGLTVDIGMTFLIDESYPLTQPNLFRVFGATTFNMDVYEDASDNPNEVSWGVGWTHIGDADGTTIFNSDKYYKYILITWPKDTSFNFDAFQDLSAGTAFGKNEDGTADDARIIANGIDDPIFFKNDPDGVGSRVDDGYGYILFTLPDDSMANATGRELKITLAKQTGDVNGDGRVSLSDAVLALKTICGMAAGDPLNSFTDVNNDEKLGLEEVIYILRQITSELEDPNAFVVNFPDADLEDAVRSAIHKPSGDILNMDLYHLFYLSAEYRDIQNLEGLQHCRFLSTLYLHHNEISDLSPLSGLMYLTMLNLSSNQITDISGLANLSNLQSLYLSSNQLSVINGPLNLVNLQALNLTYNQLSDISGLSTLSQLTWLDLGYNDEISDFSALNNLTNLTDLTVRYNKMSNTDSLSNLTNLKEIDLEWNEITDISGLSGLTNLEELSFWGNQIVDVSPLAGLTNLEELTFGRNDVVNINSLAGLENLTRLQISQNQIVDISSLAGLTNLTRLYLGNNQIADIDSLSNLVNLTTLSLEFNQLNNVDDLANLVNLQTLTLYYNEITNINGLANLVNLKSLKLLSNQVTNINPLANLVSLTSLDLRNNQIVDIHPLVTNSGIDSEDTVSLTGNLLNDDSCTIYIPQLESRGVNVYHDCQ